jgi:hypothetical protein
MNDSSPLQWADFLRERGLGNVTRFLLEATRPLHPLLSQTLHVFSPFLPLSSFQSLLEDPQSIDTFISLLGE